jgi:glycosyltransferase 2 family protein
VKKTFKAVWPYLRIVLSLLLLWLAARNIDWQALT